VKDGEWLRPLELKRTPYLEDDLSQVLKYKGKTNADFNRNDAALRASRFGVRVGPYAAYGAGPAQRAGNHAVLRAAGRGMRRGRGHGRKSRARCGRLL
jgi:hypothetical protein